MNNHWIKIKVKNLVHLGVREQLEGIFSFCKHLWNDPSMVWGWRDRPAFSMRSGYGAQTAGAAVIQRKAGLWREGRPGETHGRTGFCSGPQRKPEIWVGRQGRGPVSESEERFWLMFMENLIGTTFILVARKQTVMQDKEEKGEYLGKAITNPSEVRDPRWLHLKCDFSFLRKSIWESKNHLQDFFFSRTKRQI